MRREQRHREGTRLPRVALLTSDSQYLVQVVWLHHLNVSSLLQRGKVKDWSGQNSQHDCSQTCGGGANNILCGDKKNWRRGTENLLPKKWLESSQDVPNTNSTQCQVHTQVWMNLNALSLATSSWENYPQSLSWKREIRPPTCKATIRTRDLIWKAAGQYQVRAGWSPERKEAGAKGKVGRVVFKQLGLWKWRCAHLPSIWLLSHYASWTWLFIFLRFNSNYK